MSDIQRVVEDQKIMEILSDEVNKPLQNLKNYYIYSSSVEARVQPVVTVPRDITINTIDDHIVGIYNILRDGIEDPYIHNTKVKVSWGGDIWCELSFIDYWFCLFMWHPILKIGESIKPKHIFYDSILRRKHIKSFIDRFLLTKENKIAFEHEELCNKIADCVFFYSYTDTFGLYLANTINNEDDIGMMNNCPEYDALVHKSYENIPFDQIKETADADTQTVIKYIMNSKQYLGYNHGLTSSFKAKEAINDRQYRESRVVIGPKSVYDKVYPINIANSFSNGGVNNPLYYFTESSAARTAQILSKINVGDSGDFARLLGLNNIDTILNLNRNYQCMSRHFVKFIIKSAQHLSKIKNRYYRFNPNGMEYLIDDTDESLIGKTVYLRSPMTCSSLSDHNTICKRCYGDLYYTNYNINAGKFAAEILSSILTQRLLSTKHLLETIIAKIIWNAEFFQYFNIDINCITLNEIEDESILKKMYLVINPDNIYLVDEEEDVIKTDDDFDMDDDATYSEYITYFHIRMPDGSMIRFGSEDQDSLYISRELNLRIRRKGVMTDEDDNIMISLDHLTDINLFYIQINNNEISKTMNDIIHVINKGPVTESMNKDEALQAMIDLVVSGGLDIDSVHLEVILANQIVTPDEFKKPNWNDPQALHRMITLNTALVNNRSVIISMLYKDLHKVFYNPLTYKKRAPSKFDLFFMKQPQVYMSKEITTDEVVINDDGLVEMCKLLD